MNMLVRAAVLGLWLVVSVVVPRHAVAGYLGEAGLGTGSAIATFLYAPIKLVYATVGGVLGGLGYVFSAGSVDVAKKIWVPSLGGTYVITPDMLTGDEVIRFFGSTTSSMDSADIFEDDSMELEY